jgi:hypothetical protein
MIEKTVGNEKCDSAKQLANIFEQSLAVLCDGKKALTANRPIGRALRNSLPVYLDAASLQKRALDDAAKALATLWKIEEPGRGKPASRTAYSAR